MKFHNSNGSLEKNKENYDTYLIRPLSPSLSLSQLENSSFSFGESSELDKLMTEMRLLNGNIYENEEQNYKNEDSHTSYTEKIKENSKEQNLKRISREVRETLID